MRVKLSVDGMSCASCVLRVEKALHGVPGVLEASVNLATQEVNLKTEEGVAHEALVEAVGKVGYEVRPESVSMEVDGMTCASCVGRVERALLAVPGTEEAIVNLATHQAHVRGTAGAAAWMAAIEKAGYGAALREAERAGDRLAARQQEEEERLRRLTKWAVLLALPVFLLEMGGHMIPAFGRWIEATIGLGPSWIFQMVLTTLVLAIPGRSFYLLGFPALFRGAPDMNALVAVGTLAAYLYSLVATFVPGWLPAGTVHVYYEAAAVIVALVLLGRLLEARAKGRTSVAIQRLIGLEPKMARVEREGEWVELPLEAVVVGDKVQVVPGARVPVDGVVLSGESYVDESMITGESMPVAKTVGAKVVGGTINDRGALVVEAQAVGEASVLQQIIQLVEDAQASKLPIQAMVDKITLYFVPAVMISALVTFGLWMWLGPSPALSLAIVNAVAVLIIACPCAMGLATPTSIMVGTGRGAELGVLFRKGDALQGLSQVGVVAFDKTGTLTEGKPVLTDLELVEGWERHEVLRVLAAAESQSEHPIAKAIIEAAAAEGVVVPELEQFESITGFGLEAQVEGRRVLVGADRLMRREGIGLDAFEAAQQRLGEEGKSPLYVAVDGALVGLVAVSDPVKESSAKTLAGLQARGLRVAMITGDNQKTAEAIAKTLGIDEVVAEVLPGGKVDALEALRASMPGGAKIAFVGDGINDAPALAHADVGIAIGAGTDVAMESADLVLMGARLDGVLAAIELSDATLKNIRQNLFWAFAYNTALIPVAAGILYPSLGILLSPVFAAGAMAMSSVFVLSNALRLRGFRSSVEVSAS